MILMINQPTSTAFYMKNNFWTKISKNGHCDIVRETKQNHWVTGSLKAANFLRPAMAKNPN